MDPPIDDQAPFAGGHSDVALYQASSLSSAFISHLADYGNRSTHLCGSFKRGWRKGLVLRAVQRAIQHILKR